MNFHKQPTTFVDQVNIKVQDIGRSLQFYRDVIGFEVLERSDYKAKLTTDGKNVLLSIEQPNNVVPKKRRTTGLYHFALLLPKRSDLANTVRHFVKIGLQFGSADHLVSEALYLSDPDGNGIEIYIDRDPSEWSWNNNEVDMTTDPLDFSNLLAERQQEVWGGLPADTVMGHIHLQVSELEKAEEFYIKGLGFEVVNRYGTQALFISHNNYHHHIALNTWAGIGVPTPPLNSVGLKSFSIILPDEKTRNNVVSKLKNIGATVTEDEGTFITYDPSGNCINLDINSL
ncbi:VOC family protein [Virgibacillus sp. W0181]|uniref:VOC family protein n=1 Tax=Virgibacillus sp. W0181 TaxID=3391581 RepID=UPI003F46D536